MEPVIDYVIGIDFGHGETSAAICPLQWNEHNVALLDKPTDIDDHGIYVFPSAIRVLNNGDVNIGHNAFSFSSSENGIVSVCFKKAPTDINGEKEQLMIKYMKAVYNSILAAKAGTLTEDNHKVFIATPSGWDKNATELYRQMAEQAGIPVGGVTQESRAALVHAQHDAVFGIGKDIEKGAVVFDMGSSTLDLTYYCSDLNKPIDYGYDCGASLVEKNILNKLEKNDPATKQFLMLHPELRDYLLYEIRKNIKEEYYKGAGFGIKKYINFDQIVDDPEIEGERVKIVYNQGDLTKELYDCGYVSLIEKELDSYRQEHINGRNIEYVLLTGGASRMDFIANIVNQRWGVPIDHVKRDDNPSLTISRGIAELARMDMRTAKSIGEIIEKVSKIDRTLICKEMQDAFPNTLTKNSSPIIKKYINNQEVLKNELTKFFNDSSQKKDAMIDSLKASIQDKLKQCSIQNLVDEVVNTYASAGFSVGINITDISISQMDGKNFKRIIDSTFKADNNGGSFFSSPTFAGVCTGLGALLGIGLLGGGLIAIASYLLFGRSKERGITEITETIQNKIKESITNNPKALNEFNNTVKDLTDLALDGYVEELNRVRKLLL